MIYLVCQILDTFSSWVVPVRICTHSPRGPRSLVSVVTSSKFPGEDIYGLPVLPLMTLGYPQINSKYNRNLYRRDDLAKLV